MVEMEHSYISRENKIIKIFILFSFLFVFTSCASIPVEREWQDIKKVNGSLENMGPILIPGAWTI